MIWELPALKSLALGECNYLLRSFATPTHLQRLCIRGSSNSYLFPYATWTGLWTACSALEDVEADLMCIGPGEGMGWTAPFQCPNLSRLKVQTGARLGRHDLFFLENLQTGSVRYLRLRGSTGDYNGNGTSVIKQNSSTLERLSLVGVDNTWEKARDLLQYAPEVKTLKVSSSAFITALKPDVLSYSWLCSRLSTLKAPGFDFSIAELVDLMKRRGVTARGPHRTSTTATH